MPGSASDGASIGASARRGSVHGGERMAARVARSQMAARISAKGGGATPGRVIASTLKSVPI